MNLQKIKVLNLFEIFRIFIVTKRPKYPMEKKRLKTN